MIAIIDYGIGNIRSLQNALDYIGVSSLLTRDSAEIASADGLILPGVGAFGEAMRRIDQYALRTPLKLAVESGKPLLGICLGYQILMRSSNEQGLHQGLGFLPLDVIRLPVNARLPHVGWSAVREPADHGKQCALMAGLNEEFFYFVHSYGVMAANIPLPHATAAYGECELLAVVESRNIHGTQFHPEKSGEAGMQLLRNFSGLCV